MTWQQFCVAAGFGVAGGFAANGVAWWTLRRRAVEQVKEAVPPCTYCGERSNGRARLLRQANDEEPETVFSVWYCNAHEQTAINARAQVMEDLGG